MTVPCIYPKPLQTKKCSHLAAWQTAEQPSSSTTSNGKLPHWSPRFRNVVLDSQLDLVLELG
ncbi:hypothetical protein N431DRAFT_425734 [Stipitochalara longipes BDJ]|nr:hypothetical protein N431DRAFT_425734 [Stipitochalara longipes BDJ]